MANMIANKGLPVELEPTEGLFAGRTAAAAAAAAAATANVAATEAAAESGTAGEAAAGKAPDTTAAGMAAEVPATAEASSAALSLADAAATTATNLTESSKNGASVGGKTVALAGGRPVGGTGGVVDANAAWISSNAKAKERSAGTTSDQALGAAGKMRAEVSSGVLPMLQGFVPGPVTDLLAVSNPADPTCLLHCVLRLGRGNCSQWR